MPKIYTNNLKSSTIKPEPGDLLYDACDTYMVIEPHGDDTPEGAVEVIDLSDGTYTYIDADDVADMCWTKGDDIIIRFENR